MTISEDVGALTEGFVHKLSSCFTTTRQWGICNSAATEPIRQSDAHFFPITNKNPFLMAAWNGGEIPSHAIFKNTFVYLFILFFNQIFYNKPL